MIGCRVAIQTFDSFHNKKAVHLMPKASGKIFITSEGKPSGVLKKERNIQPIWTSTALKVCDTACCRWRFCSVEFDGPRPRVMGKGLSTQRCRQSLLGAV